MNSITQGNILKALLKFFFPILLGTFFQQLYNTIDAIVTGQFAGKESLAAVGGSSAVFVQLIVVFFMGSNYSAPKIPGIKQGFQQRQVLQLQRRLSHVFLLSRYKNGF